MNKRDELLLVGHGEQYLVPWPDCDGQSQYLLHPNVLTPLLELKRLAAKEGFDLALASAHRGRERQLAIWNAKARGQKTLLDSDGIALDYSKLTKEEVVFSILRWSAIPGASRHHWGCDVDVYDRSHLEVGQSVELTPQEVAPEGPMGEFHLWLDELISSKKSLDFFRPYNEDRGGVAPEKWHLSFGPQALIFEEALSYEHFLKVIDHNDIELGEILQEKSRSIYDRFVINTLSFTP